jgi:tetratricopeptide (TPR) repeat protein
MSIESVLLGAEQRHDRALRELDNVRAVLAWALETGRFELAADLATRLENLWATRDPTEGGRLFDEILAHAEDLPEELVARALRCRGSNATIYGDLELGRSLYERSLAVYREIGDQAGVGVLLHRLAVESLRMDGDVKRARALAEQSLALHRAHGAVNGEAQALSLLADVAWTEGDRPAAFELLRESVALAREGGFRWWEAAVVGDLAEWALELGRIDEARAAAERSLELVGPMQSRQQTILALAVFARVAVAEGRQAAAGLVWGAIEAEERRGRVGLWEQHRDAYAAIVLASPTPEFEAARRDGARLSLDEAVEHALGKKTAPSHV